MKPEDRAYREALGLPLNGPLPGTLGTIAHGGSPSARGRARRAKRSGPPRGVRLPG